MGKPTKVGSVASAICEMCGEMQFAKKYYKKDGNAANFFIVCKSCQRKGKEEMKVLFTKKCPICKEDRRVVRRGSSPPMCMQCQYPYDEKTWIQK